MDIETEISGKIYILEKGKMFSMKIKQWILITVTLTYIKVKTEELNFGVGMTEEIPIVKTYKETEIEIELNSKSINEMKEELKEEWKRFKETVELVMEEYSITGGEDNETITNMSEREQYLECQDMQNEDNSIQRTCIRIGINLMRTRVKSDLDRKDTIYDDTIRRITNKFEIIKLWDNESKGIKNTRVDIRYRIHKREMQLIRTRIRNIKTDVGNSEQELKDTLRDDTSISIYANTILGYQQFPIINEIQEEIILTLRSMEELLNKERDILYTAMANYKGMAIELIEEMKEIEERIETEKKLIYVEEISDTNEYRVTERQIEMIAMKNPSYIKLTTITSDEKNILYKTRLYAIPFAYFQNMSIEINLGRQTRSIMTKDTQEKNKTVRRIENGENLENKLKEEEIKCIEGIIENKVKTILEECTFNIKRVREGEGLNLAKYGDRRLISRGGSFEVMLLNREVNQTFGRKNEYRNEMISITTDTTSKYLRGRDIIQIDSENPEAIDIRRFRIRNIENIPETMRIANSEIKTITEEMMNNIKETDMLTKAWMNGLRNWTRSQDVIEIETRYKLKIETILAISIGLTVLLTIVIIVTFTCKLEKRMRDIGYNKVKRTEVDLEEINKNLREII